MEIGNNMPVNGGGYPTKPPPQPLTEDQKRTATTILEEYEGKELTEEDAQNIVQVFKDAGIKPGEDLKTIVEDAGFEAGEIANLAGIERPKGRPPQGGSQPPPPPSGVSATGINQESLQTLQDILSSYEDLSNLTEDQEQTLTQQLSESGLLNPGALVDTKT